MKQITFDKMLLLIICSCLLFFSACEYDGPEAVWDPNKQGAPDPVITSIDPADSAVAGEFLITLNGDNFSDDIAGNIVTFANLDNFYQVINGEGGKILEVVSAEIRNASRNSVTVYRPKIMGDSCRIQFSARDSYHLYTYQSPYRLTSVSSVYLDLERAEEIRAMAMDNQENLYIYMADKTVHKVTPEGERTYFCMPDKPSIVNMRVGPGGNLYLSRQRYGQIYIVSPDTALSTTNNFPEKVSSFDFDENGNIFAGGRESNLIIRNSDGIFDIVGDYEEFEIYCVRIFNGYVYVYAEYRGDTVGAIPVFAIWRSMITSGTGGTGLDVGARELVLDWSFSEGGLSDTEREVGEDFSDSEIMDMTFSALEAGGDLFIATNNGTADTDNSTDPILIVHADGSFEPLYKGGLLLPEDGNPEANKLVWGNSEYVYVYNKNTESIIRLGMKRNGAPYYGREL